ncbi:MAG: anthranilate phosphoribosyltransferase [Brevinematales bacterium]
MILVIDNYDSFIYNVVQYVGEFYSDIKVFRNDEINLDEVKKLDPSGIIISPGPGRPEDSKVSLDLIRNCMDTPLLGVCLGHQAIGYVYGANIIQAKSIMHGKASTIKHNGNELFANVPESFKAIRYHSLVIDKDSNISSLEIIAESDDGEIMGVKVKDKPIYGVQFHPESILTDSGKKIIENFVNMVKEKEKRKNYDKTFSKFKDILSKLIEKKSIEFDESYEMMKNIMNGYLTPSQIASYLVALRSKGETSIEIAGSAKAMFEVCSKVEVDFEPLIDTCGSGGDKSETFNISTAVSFVLAGANCYVAKHGNRSITSKSGAADVLEKLGVNIMIPPEKAKECLKEARLTFMFAPLYHPAMKQVMPVRKEIGVRTMFNILGPIVNPAGVRHHIMGVFSKELLELIPEVFVKLGHKHSLVIHGEMGLDEASIEGKTFVKEIKNGEIFSWELYPEKFNLSGKMENVKVKSPEESANLILSVLKGEEKGDARKIVILNAGLGLYISQEVPLENAFKLAEESIDSGRAFECLEKLKIISNRGGL